MMERNKNNTSSGKMIEDRLPSVVKVKSSPTRQNGAGANYRAAGEGGEK